MRSSLGSGFQGIATYLLDTDVRKKPQKKKGDKETKKKEESFLEEPQLL